MVEHDDFTRYTGRINLDYDITDFLKFGTSTTLGYTDVSSPDTSLYTAVGFRPDFPIYNEDGSYYKEGTSYNPVASNNAKSYKDNYSILSASFLELSIWRGLKLKTSLSINQNMSYSESYTPTYLTADEKGAGSESTSRSFTTVFDNTLSWNGRINDVHALDAVVGISFERTKTRSFGVRAKNYPMDEILTGITNASEIVSKSGGGTVYGLQSSFARINYRLLDKYLFTFTASHAFVAELIRKQAQEAGILLRRRYNDYTHTTDFTVLNPIEGQEWAAGDNIQVSLTVKVPACRWHKKGVPYLDTFYSLHLTDGNLELRNTEGDTSIATCRSTEGCANRKKYVCPKCGKIHIFPDMAFCKNCQDMFYIFTVFGKVLKGTSVEYKGKKYPSFLFKKGRPVPEFRRYLQIEKLFIS